MTQEINEYDIRRRLKNNFEYYAQNCLWIYDKITRKHINFRFNSAQHYVHNIIETQKTKLGKVRVAILKGRQQGISTYVEGRFYWLTTHANGVKSFILTHKQASTNTLFEMVKHYHKYCPEQLRPEISKSNSSELDFYELDSMYRIGTAGSSGVGRGETISNFHGSECGFWQNAGDHAAGIFKALPTLNSESILESTSAGPDGFFYNVCWDAYKNPEKSDYKLIFVSWYWQPEYSISMEHFREGEEELTYEEKEYMSEYKLNHNQMIWRRREIREFAIAGGRGIIDFRREFPATVEEAFKSAVKGALWKREQINRLMDMSFDQLREKLVYVVVAVDPSLEEQDYNDEHGISVVGVAQSGLYYVLADGTFRGSPTQCAVKVRELYNYYNANEITYEKNVGGQWVKTTLQNAFNTRAIKIEGVIAYQSKRLRAEPIQALYEQGLVRHVGHHNKLEDEMINWIPDSGMKSPNRLDALVYALKKASERPTRVDGYFF